METLTKEPVKATEMSKKDYLLMYLNQDWLSDEKIELIYKLVNMNNPNLRTVLEIGGYDTKQCFDSAYPCEYAKKIREILPDFDKGWHFYNYAENSWGEMTNAYNIFAKKIIKTFSGW